MNRAAARTPLVGCLGPASCPACGEHSEFRTDRIGRLVEQCGCGFRAYVVRRSGRRDEVAAEIATTESAPAVPGMIPPGSNDRKAKANG